MKLRLTGIKTVAKHSS